MEFLASVWYRLVWWLFRPLLWVIRYKVAPTDAVARLRLDPNRPVCYVLPTRSWADLFLLDRACRDLGLPRPHRTGSELPTVERPAYLYLPAILDPPVNDPAIEGVVQSALGNAAFDVQLVPVSVFWGRDPGQETSLFKLIFADSVQASAVRKFFIMLVNGRNVLVSFGLPLSFRSYISGVGDTRRATRKLARAFNIHFLRVRTATLGPTLLRRPVVIRGLLQSRGVRLAIEREAREQGQTIEEVSRRAHRYATEIAADYSAASINFLERVLTPVWNRVFKGIEIIGLERVREWAQSYEVIYLPSHRSHADYLLISYTLYHAGLVAPHIAAGVNLNFWPVGGLLRRCGAFYMRRSFSGDKLYVAIFRAYVDSLLRRGYAIEFFPEGGRSRTGRLLTPRTGLMAMVVESALRQRTRKVAIVPVYIGYDKVWEGASYFKELSGGSKQRESAQGLLKATRMLTKSYGRAYLNFGEPIRLQDFADAQLPGWREQFGSEEDPQRPEGFPALVDALALETMTRINAGAVANPMGLFACALLAAPQKAASEGDLIAQIDTLVKMLASGRPDGADPHLPLVDPRSVLEWSAPIARVDRIAHSWGDLIDAPDRSAVLLTYYRNNVQHLFALPSLIANFFRTRHQLSEETVVTGCRALYPFLQTELFLRWPPAQSEAAVRDWMERMIKLGLLQRVDGHLQRPSVDSAAFGNLAMLARIMGETLERYSMTTLLLAEARLRGEIRREAFEQDCRLLAERVAVLTGRNAPEFFDPALFRGYINTLISVGLVSDNDGLLQVDPKIQRVADRSLELLGGETQQIVLQVLARRRAPAPALAA